MRESGLDSEFSGSRPENRFPAADVERRKRRRFTLSLPVSVRFEDAADTEIRGVTRDVSSGGAFVFLQTKQLVRATSAELMMELPAEVTLCEALHVRCRVRVLRIERGADGLIGIALQITEFDFLSGA